MSDQANYVAATSKNHSAARRIGFVGNPATSISKRMFDKVAAAALLVVSAQLLVLIAIAIRIESRGPVLFRQERFGLDGATIKLTKFRTMYHHMADANGREEEAREGGDHRSGVHRPPPNGAARARSSAPRSGRRPSSSRSTAHWSAPGSVSRRSSAGAARAAGSSAPRSSSRSPRRPASSSPSGAWS